MAADMGRFAYKKTVLPNGLRVITEEIPHVRSVSVGFWIGVGSRHETESLAGVSHFIEHLLFKGTETRSARQIAEAIDAIGGHLNAFTSKECTCFYARVLDDHFPMAVDVLADMLLHSRLDAGDVEKEKNVVVEEIMMYEDTPEELVHDIFSLALWPGHPLGRAVQGTVRSVRGLGHPEIIDYFHRHYVPENMVVAAAGNIPHERVVEEALSRFGGLAGTGGFKPPVPPQSAQGTVYREKEIEQVHLCLGAEGIPLGDARIYSLHLLSNILGGGTSSRLFQEIREERGLAYSVYAFHNSYQDSGLAGIYLATSPASASAALSLARAEIARIKEEGVGKEELQRNKDQMKTSVVLGLESTSSRMTHLGKSELVLGRVLTPDEIIERIERVIPEDVCEIARQVWVEERVGMAAVGPAGTSELA